MGDVVELKTKEKHKPKITFVNKMTAPKKERSWKDKAYTMLKCYDEECYRNARLEEEVEDLKKDAGDFSIYYGNYTKMECDLRQIKSMSLWDRIFNWPY